MEGPRVCTQHLKGLPPAWVSGNFFKAGEFGPASFGDTVELDVFLIHQLLGRWNGRRLQRGSCDTEAERQVDVVRSEIQWKKWCGIYLRCRPREKLRSEAGLDLWPAAHGAASGAVAGQGL